MAFAEITIMDSGSGLSGELVARQLDGTLLEEGLTRLDSDGFSTITGTPGPIDYSSNQFVVSVVEENGQVVIGVYEEASDFSESGVALISRLMRVIDSWLPNASVEFRKIAPKVNDPENGDAGDANLGPGDANLGQPEN